MGAEPPRTRAHAAEGCKQIFWDGQHLADAATPKAAQAIVVALNCGGLATKDLTDAETAVLCDFYETGA